ncbi:alpha/beta hydrolase [candidate division WOR-3 bacterium]|nr:alpha/beta hydrolase [candidate division WOR-3 bacterium]
MKRVILGLMALVAAVFAQSEIEGKWEGAIQIQGIELGMEVEFIIVGEELTATIGIPQQGLRGFKLTNVSFEDPKVHFDLAPDPTTLVVFDGEMTDHGIKGDFVQGPATGTFYLAPYVEVQVPYTEEEVEIKSTGDITLEGTLSIPEVEKPFPAVILITGSGKQDRDENIFGFKIFKMIADHLTRNGIAVLRSDDRGFLDQDEGGLGESTSRDYAEDVKAQIEYLKMMSMTFGEMPLIDTTRIGLLGHSEGAIIAGMVAADNPDIEFVILMGGTAVPGDEALRAQAVALMEAEGSTPDEIAEQRELQDMLLAYAISGEGEEELRKELEKVTKKHIKKEATREERKAIGNLNEWVEKRVQGQLDVVRSPWYRYFLEYDPREDLANVDARVLAFFGAKDVQVVAEQNAPALEALFKEIGKENYVIKTCCRANHLFQPAQTGAFSEYSKLPKEFAPCFLPAVTAFILGEPIPDECDHKEGCQKEGNKEEGCQKAKEGGCPNSKEQGCPHAK